MRVCAQTLGVFDLIQTSELKLAVFVACHSIDLRWCFPCGFFVSWSCWCLLPCGYKRLSDWRKTTVPYCFNHFWSFLICNTFYIFRWFNATKQDRPNIKLTSLDSWTFSIPLSVRSTGPCRFRTGNIWSLQPSLPPVCYPWYRSFVGSWSVDIPWELDSSLQLQLHERHRWIWTWMFPKIVVPHNGWFIMEHPIKMDDLGVPPFSETAISDIFWFSPRKIGEDSQFDLYLSKGLKQTTKR